MRQSAQPSSAKPIQRQAVFAGTPDSLERVHAALREFAQDMAAHGCALSEQRRAQFEIAVVEIATNVMRHALTEGAIEDTPRLELEYASGRVEARFSDRGHPLPGTVSLSSPPMPSESELAESGYGLPLVCKCVDSVSYRRTDDGQNLWHLRIES